MRSNADILDKLDRFYRRKLREYGVVVDHKTREGETGEFERDLSDDRQTVGSVPPAIGRTAAVSDGAATATHAS